MRERVLWKKCCDSFFFSQELCCFFAGGRAPIPRAKARRESRVGRPKRTGRGTVRRARRAERGPGSDILERTLLRTYEDRLFFKKKEAPATPYGRAGSGVGVVGWRLYLRGLCDALLGQVARIQSGRRLLERGRDVDGLDGDGRAGDGGDLPPRREAAICVFRSLQSSCTFQAYPIWTWDSSTDAHRSTWLFFRTLSVTTQSLEARPRDTLSNTNETCSNQEPVAGRRKKDREEARVLDQRAGLDCVVCVVAVGDEALLCHFAPERGQPRVHHRVQPGRLVRARDIHERRLRYIHTRI